MTQCLPKKSCLKQSNTEGSGRTTTAHKHDDSTALALTVIKEESRKRANSLETHPKHAKRVKTESPKTTAVSKSAAEAPRSDITDLTSPPPPKRNAKISGNDKAQDSAAAASNQNDPSSHVIFSLDCSGSIRERDVKSVGGNITPWGAVFKCVDSLIDEQVNQNGSDADTCCFVSVLIFNTEPKVLLKRLLLNKDGNKIKKALKDDIVARDLVLAHLSPQVSGCIQSCCLRIRERQNLRGLPYRWETRRFASQTSQFR